MQRMLVPLMWKFTPFTDVPAATPENGLPRRGNGAALMYDAIVLESD
jgi:hypothetical protein